MRLAVPSLRLLPVTIAVLACLIGIKSVHLVRAATETASAGKKEESGHGAKEHAPPSQPAPAAEPAGPPPPPPVSEAERTILQELRSRRQELDSRDASQATREATLTALQQKLSGRVEELQALQTRLEGLDADRRKREDASWQGLVRLYESMKPREAATIFNDLDMPTLLRIVDRMKEAKAAPVMAAMNPDKARDVTTQLAQMRLRRESPQPPAENPRSHQ